MASFLKKKLHSTRESINAAKNKADVLIAAAAVDIHANVESTMQQFEVNYEKYLEKPVILTGKVWKRRGGIAKFNKMGGAWQMRRLELRGTALLYYSVSAEEDEIVFGGSSRALGGSETSGSGSATNTPTKQTLTAAAFMFDSPNMNDGESSDQMPRDLLDLAKEKATVHASFGHSGGAPSPFCLSIMTGLVKPETKWKLAFDDQATMMQWLAMLTDVVVQTSIDDYNVQLLKAANPNNPEAPPVFLRKPPVCEPRKQEPAAGLEGNANSNGAAPKVTPPYSHHQLWFTQDYFIANLKDGDGNNGNNTKEEPSIEKSPSSEQRLDQTRALQDLEKQHQQELKKWEDLHRRELEAAQEKIAELSQTNNAKAEANVATQAQLREKDLLQAKKSIELENMQQQLEKQKKETEHQLASLEGQISVLQTKHKEEMEALEAKHKEQLAKLDSNKDATAKSTADVEARDAELQSIKETVASQQQRLDEKEQAVAKLTSELEALQSTHSQKVKALEESVSTTEQSRILAIKLVEDQWQKKLDKEKQQAQKRVEAAIEESSKKVATSEQEDDLAAKEETISTLSAELESVRASTAEQVQSLQEQLTTAETNHKDAIKAAQAEYQEVIQELQSELQQQAQKIVEMEKVSGAGGEVAASHQDSLNDFTECDEFEDAVGG